VGDLGSARAGAEIAEAVTEGELPEPQRVFVATGTGGTAAGLVVGMADAGLAVPVTAVRVTPRPLGTGALLRRRIRRLEATLGVGGIGSIEVDGRQHRPGYGRPSVASEAAAGMAELDGLHLDPTYGAKAFAALVDAARNGMSGPLLFLSTSPARAE
jgi:D-cysteine desulfhydrase